VAIFPLISLVSPIFKLWLRLHLYDTWPGLILPYLTFSLPLAIYTLSAFFREIPWELEQAAQMDGATPFQAFVRVIAPLAAPGVFTTAILVFIFAWNEFPLRHLAHVHRRRPNRAGPRWRSSPAARSSSSRRVPSRPRRSW